MAFAAPGVWRNSDFRRLWIGQAISEVGSRVTRDGVPLAAVLVLGAGPFQMALLTALSAGAVLAFSLVAGVWVDRVRRRPILIGADVGRAVVIGSIPLAAFSGVLRMEQLYAVAALGGILTVLFDVAYQSYVPSLVEREHLVEANSKLALTGSAAEIMGPGLTGVLVQTLTAPVAILVDALSFLWSALMVALIREKERPPAPAERAAMKGEIAGGVRVVFGNPALAALAGRAATVGFFHGFFGPLYTLYAIRVVGMSPVSLGITIAVGGVGNLLGALLAPRLVKHLRLGPTFLGSAVIYGAASLLIPLAGGPLWLAIALMAASQLVGDCSWVIYFVNETSLRQAVTPDHLLGRVNAVMQLLTRGVWPIGAIMGGALAQWTGVRLTLWVAACGLLASSLWLLRGPVRELRAHPERGLKRVATL